MLIQFQHLLKSESLENSAIHKDGRTIVLSDAVKHPKTFVKI
jgi:hypothetical protein